MIASQSSARTSVCSPPQLVAGAGVDGHHLQPVVRQRERRGRPGRRAPPSTCRPAVRRRPSAGTARAARELQIGVAVPGQVQRRRGGHPEQGQHRAQHHPARPPPAALAPGGRRRRGTRPARCRGGPAGGAGGPARPGPPGRASPARAAPVRPARPPGAGGLTGAGAGGASGAPGVRRQRPAQRQVGQRALGHRQLGLLQHRRRDPQFGVQHPGHQRDPGRAADEEQAGELIGASPAAAITSRARCHRPAQQRRGHPFEVRPGELDRRCHPRHRDRRHRDRDSVSFAPRTSSQSRAGPAAAPASSGRVSRAHCAACRRRPARRAAAPGRRRGPGRRGRAGHRRRPR